METCEWMEVPESFDPVGVDSEDQGRLLKIIVQKQEDR